MKVKEEIFYIRDNRVHKGVLTRINNNCFTVDGKLLKREIFSSEEEAQNVLDENRLTSSDKSTL